MKALTPWGGLAALWLLLAVAWTWPALLAHSGSAPGLHFDLPGTVWVLSSAPRWWLARVDPLTAWPEGAPYLRPDSFVLLVVAWLGQALDPARLHGWLQVLGTAASGLAATALGRELGAGWAWAVLAGVAYAMSGPAATALLEGHAYLVVDPWLPLGVVAWLRATSPAGRPGQAVLAVACFALVAATSAYLGLVAAVLGGVVLVGAIARRDGGARPLPTGLGVGLATLLGLVYLGLFADGGAPALADYGPAARARFLVANSADLAGMLVADPAVDRLAHAKSATLPLTAVVLAAMAPVVLAGGPGVPRGARRLGVAGLALAVLAMGPWLDLGVGWLPLPGIVLSWLPEADLLKHPARLMWGAVLCVGALAAVVATRLEARSGRLAWVLGLCVLVDAFGWTGMPARQGRQVLGPASAYAAAEGPILELFPEESGYGYELDAWTQAWSCVAQAGHGQAIATDCVSTVQEAEPGRRRSRAVLDALLRGEADEARARLVADGFAAVALRPDLLTERDRRRIGPALAALDPTPARSTDGGALVELYRVGAAPAAAAPGAVDPNRKALRVARSQDGRRWEPVGGVLVQAASSPELVELDGQRWVYFVDHGERLARIPLAGGEVEPLSIDPPAGGGDAGGSPGLVVDPDLVVLDDGGLRLYVVVQDEMLDPGADGRTNRIHSALSRDGREFTAEPGVRLAGPYVDPDVLPRPGGGWRMYLTRDATRILSAVSDDGLDWRLEPGVRLEGGGVTSSTPDGEGVRTWFHERWGVREARSADGLGFGPSTLVLTPADLGAEGAGLAVESPAVLRADDGWWMVFATAPTGGAP